MKKFLFLVIAALILVMPMISAIDTIVTATIDDIIMETYGGTYSSFRLYGGQLGYTQMCQSMTAMPYSGSCQCITMVDTYGLNTSIIYWYLDSTLLPWPASATISKGDKKTFTINNLISPHDLKIRAQNAMPVCGNACIPSVIPSHSCVLDSRILTFRTSTASYDWDWAISA